MLSLLKHISEVKHLIKSWNGSMYNFKKSKFHCAKDSFQACLFQLKYCQAKLALFAYVNSSNTEHRKKEKEKRTKRRKWKKGRRETYPYKKVFCIPFFIKEIKLCTAQLLLSFWPKFLNFFLFLEILDKLKNRTLKFLFYK